MAEDALVEEVRGAAEARLEAQVSGDGVVDAARRAVLAAHAALDAGHSVAEIASAEAAGERAARERSAGQVLRSVERAARKMRDATDEYERAILHATRLGLPARDIAARAGVSHGTVAAVARRHEQPSPPALPDGGSEQAEAVNTTEPAPETGAG